MTRTRAQLQREFVTRIEGLTGDFHPHPEESQVRVPLASTSPYAVARSLKKKVGPLLASVSYQLFQFAWWSVPGSTSVERIGAVLLPDKSRVFWIYIEGDGDQEVEYSVAGTASPDVTDLRFLQLLFANNGKDFGVEVCGYPPMEIITPLRNLPELPDLFVAAYNGFPDAWDCLDDYQPEGRLLDPKDPAQARELVERHLQAVTHLPHRPPWNRELLLVEGAIRSGICKESSVQPQRASRLTLLPPQSRGCRSLGRVKPQGASGDRWL